MEVEHVINVNGLVCLASPQVCGFSLLAELVLGNKGSGFTPLPLYH